MADDVFGMEVFVDDSSTGREVVFTFTLQRLGWLGAIVSSTALLVTALFFYIREGGRSPLLGRVFKFSDRSQRP